MEYDSNSYELTAGEAGSDKKRESNLVLQGLRKIRWRAHLSTAVLCAAYVLINAAYSLIGPFFPLEAKKKGSNSLLTGVIISCAPFSVFVLSPIFGYYLPKIGLRFSILSGIFLVGGTYTLLGFTYMLPSGWIFIMMCVLLRLIEGIGSALFMTGALAIVPQLYPDSIGRVTGMIEAAGGFGYCVGPPLGGALYALGGFGLPFWTTGGFGLTVILPCLLLVKSSTYQASTTLDLKTMRKLSTNFIIVVLLFTTALAWTAFGFVTPSLQPYLYTEFGLKEGKVGLIYGSNPLCYMLGSLILGRTADKVHPHLIMIIGCVIDGLGYFFIGPAQLIGTRRICPDVDNRSLTGVISGLITSANSIGQFAGPLVGGLLDHLVGFQSSTVVLAEVLFAQGVLLLGITLIDRYHTGRENTKAVMN